MSELTYTVIIKGPEPPDLAERITRAYAMAVAARLKREAITAAQAAK